MGEDERSALRDTLQLSRDEIESDERTRELDAIPNPQSGDREHPSEGSSDSSAESTAGKSAPQAQVLKRTKLVIGDEGLDESARTGDGPTLKERLRQKRRQEKNPDATIEIETDDNVEERS